MIATTGNIPVTTVRTLLVFGCLLIHALIRVYEHIVLERHYEIIYHVLLGLFVGLEAYLLVYAVPYVLGIRRRSHVKIGVDILYLFQYATNMIAFLHELGCL